MGIVTDIILPLSLAFIMFSLGLGLTSSDFKRIIVQPKDFIVGAFSQIFILPLISLISVDLKTILGNLSASRALNELLSRLEFPLLKSVTFATTPIFKIDFSSS